MSMLDTAKIELGGLVSSLEKLNAVKTAKETEYFDEKAAKYIIDTWIDCTAVMAEMVGVINSYKKDFLSKVINDYYGLSLVLDSTSTYRLAGDIILDVKKDHSKVGYHSTYDGYYFHSKDGYKDTDVRENVTVEAIRKQKTDYMLLSKTEVIVDSNVRFWWCNLPKRIEDGMEFSAPQWKLFVSVANKTKREVEELLTEFKAVLNGIISKRSKEIQECESAKDSLAGMAEYEKISA